MGLWADALRRALWRRVPQILQSLRDDRAGLVVLDRRRRNAAWRMLRLVMSDEAIRRELKATVDDGRKGRGSPVEVSGTQPTGYHVLH